MKTNRRTGAESDTGPTVRKSISLTEAGGVYDRNPDSGLDKYPRSTGGPNEIPIKFAESIGLPNRNRNPMTSAVPERGNSIAQKPTTSRLNNKPNRYESATGVKGKTGI